VAIAGFGHPSRYFGRDFGPFRSLVNALPFACQQALPNRRPGWHSHQPRMHATHPISNNRLTAAHDQPFYLPLPSPLNIFSISLFSILNIFGHRQINGIAITQQSRQDINLFFARARLRNDLYCVGWGVKLYSLTSPGNSGGSRHVEGGGGRQCIYKHTSSQMHIMNCVGLYAFYTEKGEFLKQFLDKIAKANRGRGDRPHCPPPFESVTTCEWFINYSEGNDESKYIIIIIIIIISLFISSNATCIIKKGKLHAYM